MHHGWARRDATDGARFLIGHLHYAATVVWPGRTFLHRMIYLLCCFQKDHPICLNRKFQHDLQWWHQFLIERHEDSFWLFSMGYTCIRRGWFLGLWCLRGGKVIFRFIEVLAARAVHRIYVTFSSGHCCSCLGPSVVQAACSVSRGQQ